MMAWLMLTVAVGTAAGFYMVLSRDALRCVMGLAVLGGVANLVLLASGRLGSQAPAVVPLGQQALGDAANSLPQALVLTAIVIGFALTCFALTLVLTLIHGQGTDDALALRDAEPVPDDPVKPPRTVATFEPVWPPEQGAGR